MTTYQKGTRVEVHGSINGAYDGVVGVITEGTGYGLYDLRVEFVPEGAQEKILRGLRIGDVISLHSRKLRATESGPVTFEALKKGQTIRSTVFSGQVKVVREGVAHYLNGAGSWTAVDGTVVASNSPNAIHEILKEAPTPKAADQPIGTGANLASVMIKVGHNKWVGPTSRNTTDRIRTVSDYYVDRYMSGDFLTSVN